MIRVKADSALFSRLANELLSSGMTFRFHATGRSMLPTIQDGEVLHVQPVAPENVRIGEIVLFTDDGMFKAHRVICKRKNCFLMRGDSSLSSDGIIGAEQILGRVVAKECGRTGRLMRLSGARDRACFSLRELRKRLARS